MPTVKRFLAGVVIGLMLAAPTLAVQPDEMLADPALEARAREISKELRCVVCQNQSIDDSDAPLAKDLRRLVRERLVAGDSNPQVKSFLVERYGEFVLLKPPVGMHTLLLWLTPVVVLLLTLAFVLRSMRAQRIAEAAPPPALSDEEIRRLESLVADRERD